METIRVETHENVATVRLQRPDVRNALNEVLIAELTQAFTGLPASTLAVILAGEGPVFCAGADAHWMKKSKSYSREENERDAAGLAALLRAVDECPRPVIARVQGAALGGGAGLVAACDIAVAEEGTTFGFPEVRLGLIPAVVSTFVIPRIGVRSARRYFLTAERFDASRAQSIGLVHEGGAEEPARCDDRRARPGTAAGRTTGDGSREEADPGRGRAPPRPGDPGKHPGDLGDPSFPGSSGGSRRVPGEAEAAVAMKVLVANRGEIACRILRTLKEMAIPSVALFTDPDRDAPHVHLADEAVPLGAADRYLSIEAVITAARRSGATALHPGYGFLSQSAAFVRACEAAGLTFIGPGAESMERLGDKRASRAAAQRLGIPVVPGAQEVDTLTSAVEAADTLGYPVLLKAAGGGGGRWDEARAGKVGASRSARVGPSRGQGFVRGRSTHRREIHLAGAPHRGPDPGERTRRGRAGRAGMQLAAPATRR
jgi:methylglutaconyl-CoA hydratase